MNNWLIPLGLGAVVAAVVIATKKDNQPLPPARTRPNPLDNIRTRTPGIYTVGPPANWNQISFDAQVNWCRENLYHPAWGTFCQQWMKANSGDSVL